MSHDCVVCSCVSGCCNRFFLLSHPSCVLCNSVLSETLWLCCFHVSLSPVAPSICHFAVFVLDHRNILPLACVHSRLFFCYFVHMNAGLSSLFQRRNVVPTSTPALMRAFLFCRLLWTCVVGVCFKFLTCNSALSETL